MNGAKRTEWRDRIVEAARSIRPWQAVAVAAIVLALAIPASVLLVVAAVAVLVAIFGVEWLAEFQFLMRLGDDAFRGRNDKLIWAILLIVLPPVGLWQFRVHRQAHWPEAKPEKIFAFDDLF